VSEEGQGFLRKVEVIKSSLNDVLAAIYQAGLLKPVCKPEHTCGFHSSIEHSVEE